jgi:transcriptional regulator with XRE-family HTH domain
VTRPRAVTSVQIHGPALRYVRTLRGLSISQLARAAGVSTGFLSRVELGVKRAVGVDVFHVLVSELDLADSRVLVADPYAEAVTRTIGAHCDSCAPNVLQSSSTTRAA